MSVTNTKVSNDEIYTYTFTCAVCGRGVFNQNNRCSVCYPVQVIDVAIMEELARGYCGAERAEATMQRAMIEIMNLRNQVKQTETSLLQEKLKHAETLGSLQAYQILDAAGRVNRD